MARVIRVYPNNGMGMMGGVAGMGGVNGFQMQQLAANNQLTRIQYDQELKHVRRESDLKLRYERALMNEQFRTQKLQSALQFSGGISPYGMPQASMGVNPFMLQQQQGMGMFGGGILGGLLGGMFPRFF